MGDQWGSFSEIIAKGMPADVRGWYAEHANDPCAADWQSTIRGKLQTLPTAAIKRGLDGFDHPPCGFETRARDRHGCFTYEAFGQNTWYLPVFPWFSVAYEGREWPGSNEWLLSECLRELAERGAVEEPGVQRAVASGT